MARRLSSMLSLGSNSSDQSHHDPRSPFPFSPDSVTGGQSQTNLARKSTPELRAAESPPPPIFPLSPPVNSLLSPTLSPGPYNRNPLPPQHRPESPGSSRPISQDGSRPHSRAESPAMGSRPMTPTMDNRHSRRVSWFPGRAGHESPGRAPVIPPNMSWIVRPQSEDKTFYDLSPLINFQKVPELWNDACDTFVYLHSRESARGPSFKIDSALFAASRKLAAVAHGSVPGNSSRRASHDTHPHIPSEQPRIGTVSGLATPPLSQRGSSNKSSSTGRQSTPEYFEERPQKRDIHLSIPSPLQANLTDPTARLTENDVEIFVAIRNMFAFLSGLPLVATSRHPSLFDIFLRIADALHRYEFTNLDGTSLGEEAHTAFTHCVADFNIADVRQSREKTIEAVVLGEHMKHWPLYNEGFVHAIGKYEEVVGLRSPKFSLISDVTQKRMERSTLDLGIRDRNLQTRLNDFDFPSLFAGFAQSSTSSESKIINFKNWKNSYSAFRRHVITFYKSRYGAWPPKAGSKKNSFMESGLNRSLLQEVYTDFANLYDVLVDRTQFTTRVSDTAQDPDDATIRALRRILTENDRSVLPVQPAIPFDAPLIPALATIRRNFASLDERKRRKESMKRLGQDEINTALMQSYNRDALKSTPFQLAFMTFERAHAANKSMEEIADLRVGQWIFMYAVLQALPLVVIDAPDLKFTYGVEYFLCEVPLGGAPWVHETALSKQSWYGVAGSSGLVALPAHLVEHGVEGIYRRSHCWVMAQKWAPALEAAQGVVPAGNENHATNAQESNPAFVTDRAQFTASPTLHQSPSLVPANPPREPGPGQAQWHARQPSLPLLSSTIPPAISPSSAPGSRSQSPYLSPTMPISARPISTVNLGSLGLGLEQLPVPQGMGIGIGGVGGGLPGSLPSGGELVNGRPRSNSQHDHDPTKSFDAILAGTDAAAENQRIKDRARKKKASK